MEWFNYYGLVIIIVLMIPNIIYSLKYPKAFNNFYTNKKVLFFEQVGRYASFILMIINIPYTYLNFWFKNAFIVYITVNSILLSLYLLGWIICWNKRHLLRGYLLSIIPSIIFLFSGVMLLSIPLIIAAIIFGYCHINISVKNALYFVNSNKENN